MDTTATTRWPAAQRIKDWRHGLAERVRDLAGSADELQLTIIHEGGSRRLPSDLVTEELNRQGVNIISLGLEVRCLGEDEDTNGPWFYARDGEGRLMNQLIAGVYIRRADGAGEF